MTMKFSTGVRFIRTFGTLEVVSFVGEGIGGVLYLVGVATQRLVLEAVGFACLILAVLVLRAHLGQPTRGWRAVTKIGTAWVSRGTLVIALFTGAAAVSIGSAVTGLLPPIGALATVAAAVLAIPVVIYAGMMLRSMRAIRLWNGPFLPLSFPAHSAASGLTVAYAFAVVTGDGLASWIGPSAIVALIAAAVFSVAHLKTAPDSAGAKASLDRILSGELQNQFRFGAVVLGIVVPLLVLGFAASTGAASAILCVLAAAARVYGDFAYRNAIVTSGAYDPLWPSDATYFARGRDAATSAGHA